MKGANILLILCLLFLVSACSKVMDEVKKQQKEELEKMQETVAKAEAALAEAEKLDKDFEKQYQEELNQKYVYTGEIKDYELRKKIEDHLRLVDDTLQDLCLRKEQAPDNKTVLAAIKKKLGVSQSETVQKFMEQQGAGDLAARINASNSVKVQMFKEMSFEIKSAKYDSEEIECAGQVQFTSKKHSFNKTLDIPLKPL